MELGQNSDPFAEPPRIEEYVAPDMDVLGEILDVEVPALLEGMAYDDMQILALAKNLITVVHPHMSDNMELRSACYNGFRFGFLLADIVTPHHIGVALDGIVDYDRPKDEQWDSVFETTGELIGSSPNIDILIGRYAPDIDRSGKYAHIVELAVGMALAMVQSGESYRLIELAVDELLSDIDKLE